MNKYYYMEENITITRLSDLPDTNIQTQKPPNNDGLGADMYIPMNIHPNPYGIQQSQQGGMPMPEQTTQGRQQESSDQLSPEQISMMHEMPSQKLPQRDIPMDQTQMLHDDQVHANYIPKPKLTSDYVEEYQQSTDRKLREYEEKKHRERMQDQLIDKVQIPIMISLLFFLFHLPIVNTLILKRFSFLSIYSDDGNFNMYGLVLKSVLFGIGFYTLDSSMKFLNEF
jgi:hypothetical protein